MYCSSDDEYDNKSLRGQMSSVLVKCNVTTKLSSQKMKHKKIVLNRMYYPCAFMNETG